MATPYRPVTWGNEYISADKLNTMTSNDQYLFERMPTVFYRSYGISKKSGGMKIMAGIQVIHPKAASSTSRDVQFGSFFSQGCKPIVTTGQAMGSGGRYHIIVSALGAKSISPDHRGMNIRVVSNSVSPKDNKIHTRVNVHWHAIGW